MRRFIGLNSRTVIELRRVESSTALIFQELFGLDSVLSIEESHVRPVEPSHVAEDAQRAVNIVVSDVLLQTVLLHLLSIVVESLRLVVQRLLVHVLHLHPLLVVQLLHVVPEVLGTDHALSVVSRYHRVSLIKRRV